MVCKTFCDNNKKMKNVLIAGGAGFIGSHLCESLATNGHKVTCVDNLLTGSLQNLSSLDNHANFKFVNADICNPLPDEIRAGKFTEIYNLACPASPAQYQLHPLETLMVSALGTKNLLELAADCPAKFLHASTSEVYGDPLQHPQKESYRGNVNCVGPRSCYDEGKRFAESLIINFSRQKNVTVRIARIFNTYGPRMAAHDGRAVPEFISRALANEQIEVFGDGSQTRSFCYISDMIAGLITLMNSEEFPEPVNIGNPDERSIREMAEKIIEMTGSNSKIVYIEAKQDDPKNRKPDISLANEKLEFTPQIGLDFGLKKTIEWFAGR